MSFYVVSINKTKFIHELYLYSCKGIKGIKKKKTMRAIISLEIQNSVAYTNYEGRNIYISQNKYVFYRNLESIRLFIALISTIWFERFQELLTELRGENNNQARIFVFECM